MRSPLFCGLGVAAALIFTLHSAAQPLIPPAPLVPSATAVAVAPSESILPSQAARLALELGFPAIAVQIYRTELASADTDRNRVLLELATALLDDGQPAEAEEVLKSYIGLPTPGYRLRLALTAAALKRFEVARAEIQNLRPEDLDPSDRAWLFAVQGQIAAAGGKGADIARARDFYDKAAAASVSELQRLGFALASQQVRLIASDLKESDLDAVRARLDKAQVGSPQAYNAVGQLATALNILGRKGEAVALLQRQLQTVPADRRDEIDDWLLKLGMIAGSNEAAGRAALSRLLRESNNREKQRVALLLLAKGTQRLAFRAELDRLIEARGSPHPILEDLLLQRAYDQLLNKAYSEAAADAQRLMETFPGSALKANALGVRVQAAWASLRFRLAADYANQARDILPPGQVRGELGVLIAEAYFRAADFSAAAGAYGAALDEVPTGVSTGALIFQRVLSEIQSGRKDALSTAETILDTAANDPRLDPLNRWQAEWNLARALQVAGSTGVAFARVDRLLEGASAAAVPADLRVRMSWLRARLALDVGRAEQALVLAETLLNSVGDLDITLKNEVTGRARLLAAEANFALPGKEAIGLEILQKLRVDLPQSDEAVYSFVLEADRAAAQNSFAGAQSLLVDLADRFPKHNYAPFALYQAAVYAERRGQESNLKEANRLIERLLENYSDRDLIFYARLKQGDILRKLLLFDLAQRAYEDLVNNHSQHPQVLLAQMALAACHFAQAPAESSEAGKPAGHVESAIGIYERLVDRPDASTDLRIEAGYNLGLILSRRGQGEGRARAQTVWWQQVVAPYLLDDAKAVALGANGRFWIARTLLGLGELLEQEKKFDQAREAYDLLLKKRLPGESRAKERLVRLGAVPGRV